MITRSSARLRILAEGIAGLALLVGSASSGYVELDVIGNVASLPSIQTWVLCWPRRRRAGDVRRHASG